MSVKFTYGDWRLGVAEVMGDSFGRGVELALQRARGYGIEVPFDAIVETETLAMMQEVIETWPTSLTSRFQTVFVENVTLATIARVRYEDRPLNHADIRAYLGHSEMLFNSFTHDE